LSIENNVSDAFVLGFIASLKPHRRLEEFPNLGFSFQLSACLYIHFTNESE